MLLSYRALTFSDHLECMWCSPSSLPHSSTLALGLRARSIGKIWSGQLGLIIWWDLPACLDREACLILSLGHWTQSLFWAQSQKQWVCNYNQSKVLWLQAFVGKGCKPFFVFSLRRYCSTYIQHWVRGPFAFRAVFSLVVWKDNFLLSVVPWH